MPRSSGSSCLNCRARKVRCDRISPRCSQCRQRSLDCLVPAAPPRVLWLPTRTVADFDLELDQSEVDMHVRRQPLFKSIPQKQNPKRNILTVYRRTTSAECSRLAFPYLRLLTQCGPGTAGLPGRDSERHSFQRAIPCLSLRTCTRAMSIVNAAGRTS